MGLMHACIMQNCLVLQDMEQHVREGILAGMLPEATAKMLAVMPRAMAIDALQTLIPPIAQQVPFALTLQHVDLQQDVIMTSPSTCFSSVYGFQSSHRIACCLLSRPWR